MMTAIKHDHRVTQFLKLTGASILALSPSLAAGMYLMNNRLPVLAPYQISFLVLLLAGIDISLVIMLEPYRRYFSKLTPPALIGTVAVVFLFALAESLNRFFEHMGYTYLTPFVIACIALIYATIFLEKNVALKCFLSLNSIGIMALWAMGSIDKLTMPF